MRDNIFMGLLLLAQGSRRLSVYLSLLLPYMKERRERDPEDPIAKEWGRWLAMAAPSLWVTEWRRSDET